MNFLFLGVFSRAGGQIKGQTLFFKDVQAFIKSVFKSKGFSRNQGRVGTLVMNLSRVCAGTCGGIRHYKK